MATMAANSELPDRPPGLFMFATVLYMTCWGREGEGRGGPLPKVSQNPECGEQFSRKRGPGLKISASPSDGKTVGWIREVSRRFNWWSMRCGLVWCVVVCVCVGVCACLCVCVCVRMVGETGGTSEEARRCGQRRGERRTRQARSPPFWF